MSNLAIDKTQKMAEDFFSDKFNKIRKIVG